MADGRVFVNTAVFYNDYKDLQVQTFLRPGVVQISNAASATITGLEFEATAAVGAAYTSRARSRGSTRPTTATLPQDQAM